jgi:DNA-binding transcriptional regulator YiaG
MTKIYRSAVRAAVHEAMSRLYAVGLLDADSMRGFDEVCLTEVVADDRLTPVSLANPRFAARLAERLRAPSAPPEGFDSLPNWRR